VFVNQISEVVALLLSHVVRSVGAFNTPSHVPHEAVITTPLTLITNVSFDESVETISKVPVLVKVIPVVVDHHIFADHVAVVVQSIVNTTVATTSPVLPAMSLKVNVYVPLLVKRWLVVPVIVSDQLSVARTFAPVLV
jgi:inorganic pyrophosphatase/exopolyphosphatase